MIDKTAKKYSIFRTFLFKIPLPKVIKCKVKLPHSSLFCTIVGPVTRVAQ